MRQMGLVKEIVAGKIPAVDGSQISSAGVDLAKTKRSPEGKIKFLKLP